VPLSTAEIFRRLARPDNAPMPTPPAHFASILDLVTWLETTRNDLAAPAAAVDPRAAEAVAALAGAGECLIARMSGSGATAFGIFASDAKAADAAARLRAAHPDWWIAACRSGGSGGA
jgi:4-diphosphocytidyl-2-C-methyl-D-erythritol kinase